MPKFVAALTLLLAGAAATLVSRHLRGWLYRAGGGLVAALGVLFVLRGLGLRLGA